MSRSTRPLRRVRGVDHDRLTARLRELLGPTRWPLSILVHPRRYGSAWWAERAARALGTRPAIVRRCLLGRVVSARAVARLFG